MEAEVTVTGVPLILTTLFVGVALKPEPVRVTVSPTCATAALAVLTWGASGVASSKVSVPVFSVTAPTGSRSAESFEVTVARIVFTSESERLVTGV
ncbi:hypothetical protein D3C87_1392620 [compost metagenome]